MRAGEVLNNDLPEHEDRKVRRWDCTQESSGG